VNTIEWLAAALARFEVPEPFSAPPGTTDLLGASFATDFSGGDLIRDVAQAVRDRTGGRVTLRTRDPQDFPSPVRGPAAYLALVGERALIITPDGPFVAFIDP